MASTNTEEEEFETKCQAESSGLWQKPGVSVRQVAGITVVGVEDEEEIFRSVWKYYKRNASEIAAYVKRTDATRLEEESESNVNGGTSRKRKRETEPSRVPCLDFENLESAPASLRELVSPLQIQASLNSIKPEVSSSVESAVPEIRVDRAFTLLGRPGFVFIPNPFQEPRTEAYWATQLALHFADASFSERNKLSSGEQAGMLDPGLRWATLGFHYDWKNRKYCESAQSPFPENLANLAKNILSCVGDTIFPETAIINYYRKGATMGGHKDDAEWTDEAPVVSISFGNAGVYVLGGDSQTDAGPPPPIPIIVRSGDVVLLGGPSRMNLHGVPCMLKGTCPRQLEVAIENHGNLIPSWSTTSKLLESSSTASSASHEISSRLVNYLRETRINVNVRQVRATRVILDLMKKAVK